jgi:hypothetical protein
VDGSDPEVGSTKRYRLSKPPEWTKLYFKVRKSLHSIEVYTQQIQQYREIVSSLLTHSIEPYDMQPIDSVLQEVVEVSNYNSVIYIQVVDACSR